MKFFPFVLILFCANASAQSFTMSGYTLNVINQDPAFSPALKDKLVETFFIVYPQLVKEYNPKASSTVSFVIDTAYKGVAATSDDKVVFSASYMNSHPNDIDVVTHEVMHIVQAYGESTGPGWLTEGIADYARSRFGINNAAAHWSLPAYKAGQSVENSYRITARFLTWIEEKIKPGIVKDVDSQLRAHTFSDASWKNETGKTLQALWNDYSAAPEI